MCDLANLSVRRAQTISKELQALLKSSDPLYEDVERLMDEYEFSFTRWPWSQR